MKRFSMLLVALLMLVSSIASANPFSDVPASHWANEAIIKLANKGILTGYPDGTYQGNNNVSRYALAMITAKMLANIEQMADNGMDFGSITREDLQTLEKLTVEFADELALLGVKVTALEDDMEMVKSDLATVKTDVSKMKACVENGGTEKIKISGDFLVRQTNAREKNDADPNNSYAETQFRLMFKANVDENVTAVARWIVLDDGSNAKNAPAANYYFGKNLGGSTVADNQIDLAYLSIKDMFSFGGDFTFGRNFRTHGHALVMSDYVDAITYTKRAGEIDMNLNSIYNRINGVDFRQIWNLNLDTKYRDNDIYV
ncbi:MAG: S-layer homology domain-containing protein, partial [Candidatus Riflebacteria bacterium]